LVAARCLRENPAQAARGDLTIPMSCQVFFCIFSKIFYGAGMSLASAADRECLNFRRLIQLLLKLEHPNTALLAYCHAAAVCRDGQSLLMPGRSGAGKSTLTGYLVANGFAYLGDDINAIGEDDAALLPLPSCLSIKAGSWPLIEQYFPVLRQRPTLSRYGRNIRYLEPEQNYETMFAATAPSAIVFPAYSVGAATQLRTLPPLETMIRMVGAHTTIFVPATEAKIAKLIRFVEQTPAYELTYSELPEAMRAIEGLLSTHRH
jgi:hypothetical protein